MPFALAVTGAALVWRARVGQGILSRAGIQEGGFACAGTGYFASDLGFLRGLLLLLILNETILITKSDLDRGLNRCVDWVF